MALLPECGAQIIGELGPGNGHLYQFSQTMNRLLLVFVNRRGDGEVWQSRNEGLNWEQIDNIGPVTFISIRGGQIFYGRNSSRYSRPVLGSYNWITGNIVLEFPPYDANTGKFLDWTGSLAIPIPELGYVAIVIQAKGYGNSNYQFYDYTEGALKGGFPGRALFALWGSEGRDGVTGRGALNIVWLYVDTFYEVIMYPVIARYFNGSWVGFQTSYGTPLPYAFAGLADGDYEGFMNGRGSFEGVAVRGRLQIPSDPLVADHWSGDTQSQAPIWIPDLSAVNGEYYGSVASLPSGQVSDFTSSRHSVMGFVNGRKTFGLIEPGYGFAHCVGDGVYSDPATGKIFAATRDRKFMGNLGVTFSAFRAWMPFSSGVFGMGVMAQIEGKTQVLWISDKEPSKIPTSVLVEDGKYTDRDDVNASHASRTDGKYYRW